MGRRRVFYSFKFILHGYATLRNERMRSSLVRMRSSLVVRASDCQCTSCNGPGFNPSIRRHSGIWGAADEAVLSKVRKKNPPKKYLRWGRGGDSACGLAKRFWHSDYFQSSYCILGATKCCKFDICFSPCPSVKLFTGFVSFKERVCGLLFVFMSTTKLYCDDPPL